MTEPLHQLLIAFEGKSNKAYDDSAGYKTIGVGHKIQRNDEFLFELAGTSDIKDINLTDDQILILLDNDIIERNKAISEHFPIDSLTSYQQAAVFSFVFNIGVAAFLGSSIVRYLNIDDVKGAGNAFLMWNKITVKGEKVVSPGMMKRRHVERIIFNNFDMSDLDSFDIKDSMKREIIKIVSDFKANMTRGWL